MLARTEAEARRKRSFTRSELQHRIARTLGLVSRRWRARLNERLRAMGQTDARWAALCTIEAAGHAIGQRDLAGRLGIEEPTLVRTLDALEAQGLVERRASPTDRRAKQVRGTASARPVIVAGETQAASLRDEVFAGVTREEMAVCLSVLERLSVRLERT